MSRPQAEDLAEVFSQFGPAFMRWVRAGVDEEGVTFARMRLMWSIETEGPQIMSQIKEWLGVTARNVTSLVDGLESEGYVERRKHPDDRRATIVALTDEGREAFQRARRAHRKRASSLFAALDEDDQARLHEIMGQLVAELDERSRDR